MSEKKSSAGFLRNRDQWVRMLVNDPTFSHVAVRVGIHLAMRMRSDQQFCWPSIKTISDETGVSERGVSMALDMLAGGVDKDGVVHRRMIFRQSRPNVGNLYALVYPWQ